MSEFEVKPDSPAAEITAGWADAQGAAYWLVSVPYVGAVWSTDRAALAAWLRDAADQVDAAPPASDPWAEQGPSTDPWGSNPTPAAEPADAPVERAA